MTRMTGPDCVVMCNLINTYILSVQKGNDNGTYYSGKATSPENKKRRQSFVRELLVAVGTDVYQ